MRWLDTWRNVAVCCLMLSADAAQATEPTYSPDISVWQEVPIPPSSQTAERMIWQFASNSSEISWQVYLDQNRPYAKLISGSNNPSWDPVPFEARADSFRGARRFKEVDDGWLVGFNNGEFGAALYWFDRRGKHHYRISSDQVVAFFSLSDGIYALEGLAHMAVSCGSLIRIARPTPNSRWRASTAVRLPFAPATISVRGDDSMIIALSDSLVSVGKDRQVRTLIADAPWSGLYPTSSVLLPDESRLYIGMRQFVGEVDLRTNRLRLLLPSDALLNKLPDSQASHLRMQYATGGMEATPPANLCEQQENISGHAGGPWRNAGGDHE